MLKMPVMKITSLTTAAVLMFTMSSCLFKKDKSLSTGWNYNDTKWGGYEVNAYAGQETGPNLVLVQGGRIS